jgi:hypothetical protein
MAHAAALVVVEARVDDQTLGAGHLGGADSEADIARVGGLVEQPNSATPGAQATEVYVERGAEQPQDALRPRAVAHAREVPSATPPDRGAGLLCARGQRQQLGIAFVAPDQDQAQRLPGLERGADSFGAGEALSHRRSLYRTDRRARGAGKVKSHAGCGAGRDTETVPKVPLQPRYFAQNRPDNARVGCPSESG